MMKYQLVYLFVFSAFPARMLSQERMKPVSWPDSNKVVISLSFDDARLSQIDAGIPMLDQYGVKATFYLNPGPMNERIDGWKKAVAAGHEIGNHSTTHPCSGNYSWVGKGNELENLSIDEMRKNLLDCNKIIKDKLEVTPTSFAYPCGQKFIGRGEKTKTYVPLVAELFSSGRGWLDNMDNDPRFCDHAQLAARDIDGKTFEEILPLIKNAAAQGQWLILAGHEMGEEGRQTTRLSMLRKLIEYAKDPANHVWLATVSEVQVFLKKQQ